MIVIRCQFVIRYSSYLILLLIVYILRCPPFIKIDKSLTYTVCLFRPLHLSYKKIFFRKKMPYKDPQKQKEAKRRIKYNISDPPGMVNTISTIVLYNI